MQDKHLFNMVKKIFVFLILNSDCKYKDLVNCELLSRLPLHAPKVNVLNEATGMKPRTNGIVCCTGENSRTYFYMCFI